MLIDSHVHLYPAFDRARLLAAAAANLAAAARGLGGPAGAGVLFLTETCRDEAFAEMAAGQGVPDGWRVEGFAEDPQALRLLGQGGVELLIVAGRQLVSAERLEVLAVGHRDTAPDGRPAAEILAGLRAAGVPAILPWGVGKWIGARGRLVAELVAAAPGPGLLLGDNAGRPLGWATPPLFRTGLPVLPGSDPLPVSGADVEAGRYGFVLEGAPDPVRPAADIRARLMAMTAQPVRFGRRTGPLGFVRRQTQLRLQ